GCTDIIGGGVVHAHSWPYMAAIQDEDLDVYCGGALAEEQWVLTAAHCEVNKLEDRVVLGAHRVSTAEKEQQIFEVMDSFPHPEFDQFSGDNDIMLLKLNDTAKLNKYVQLLPLPDSCEDVEPGTLCQVAGWGDTAPRKPSEYLQQATLKIVDRRSCDRKYDNDPKITSNMLCAIAKKKNSPSDTCQGDSGGPLICVGQYSGIISFGDECGKIGIPGVYTLLTEDYIDWIERKIS
ncbi:GRAK protein, partial [Ptilonorhynchus violaceus]|nr:GRAK protein [Ptilonorhynchus violaceus]